MAFHVHLPSARPTPTFTLTPAELWEATRNRNDTDDFLTFLGDRNDLRSHFSYFTSLNVTITRLERMVTQTRAEMHHVYSEMSKSGLLKRAAPFIQRCRNRHQPYARPVRQSPLSSMSSLSSYHTASLSPNPNDLPIPIPQSSHLQVAGSQHNPIRIDVPHDDEPVYQRDTPISTKGILIRSATEQDQLSCFYCQESEIHDRGECIRRLPCLSCNSKRCTNFQCLAE